MNLDDGKRLDDSLDWRLPNISPHEDIRKRPPITRQDFTKADAFYNLESFFRAYDEAVISYSEIINLENCLGDEEKCPTTQSQDPNMAYLAKPELNIAYDYMLLIIDELIESLD